MAVCHISVSNWNTGLDISLEKEVRPSKIQSYVSFETWDSVDRIFTYLTPTAGKKNEGKKKFK